VTEETQASRPQPALPITGRYDYNDGTSHVSSQRNLPGDEEELTRERMQQRDVETILEDGGVVLEESGVPRAFTVTAERYPLRRRRTSAAAPIFAGRSRPFLQAAAEVHLGVARQRMTSSAWKRIVGGIVRSRAWAVFRLMISSNFMGCSTGRSAGLAPLRIFST
jgi:hypothetical protein